LTLRLKRPVAAVLIPTLIVYGIPINTQAQTVTAPPPAPVVTVNRTVPQVEPVPQVPQFSPWPTTEEISSARIFGEPVLPIGGGEPSLEENQILGAALLRFHERSGASRYAGLENFLARRPDSPYRASLLLNLGRAYVRDGYFTRALVAFEQAWTLAKSDTSRQGRAVADGAVGDLLQLSQKFGRQQPIEALLNEVKDRDVVGAATEKITAGIEALDLFKNHHEMAIPSGSTALWRVKGHLTGGYTADAAIKNFHASHEGASLEQMDTLARTIGLKLTPVYRVDPSAPVPIPSLAHFRVGHFTAIVGETATHYKLDDIPLGDPWVTKEALADESSGYFLISGQPGPGWRKASKAELAKQRGKCASWAWLWNAFWDWVKFCSGDDITVQGEQSNVSLNAELTPVDYDPPVGPPMDFTLIYNQRDQLQPDTPDYSNVGPKWTHNWLTYVVDDPANPASPPYVYLPNARYEQHTSSDGSSSNRYTQAGIARVSTDPISYERRLPDGGRWIYGQSNGATSPRKIFVTQMIDPQGESLTFTYDSNVRLVAVTNAIGQVATLEYGHSGDKYKITKVADPFGRAARLEYDGGGKLAKVSNAIGHAWSFEYGKGDFIRGLSTPRRKMVFKGGSEDIAFTSPRFLEVRTTAVRGAAAFAVSPGESRHRLEFRYANAAVPDFAAIMPPGFGANSGLSYRSSYYWNPRAIALYGAGDYSKARVTQWAWEKHTPNGLGTLTNIRAGVRSPLGARAWHAYAGGDAYQLGPVAKPSKVGAAFASMGGSQIHRYEYSRGGFATRYTSPMGRVTAYDYAPNGIDRVRVRQKHGAAFASMGETTYNNKHLPTSIKGVNGKTTSYSYNSRGKPLTITNPQNQTVNFTYVNDVYPATVSGAPGSPTVSVTQDGYGRLRTITSEGRTFTFDYDIIDRPTRITYPDGTYEEFVYNGTELERSRDRAGRWTNLAYDAPSGLVTSRDPAGVTTSQQSCACGGEDKFVDGAGNVTRWERDDLGRVIKEIKADNSTTEITYDADAGWVTQVKDPKNQIMHLEYFLDGALKQVSFTNAVNPPPTVQYTYDAFGRIATRTDGTGTTTYTYKPIADPPATDAGELESVDGPLPNDTITYTYDDMSRVTGETVGGASWTRVFDTLGRVTGETNPLGSFTYNYVGSTQRLNDIAYPNGQTTTFGYYPADQNFRLQEIHHKRPGGTTLAKHSYTYDAVANVKAWTQQVDSDPAKVYEHAYDATDQLVAATLKTTGGSPTVLKTFAYAYDAAGNRTSEQVEDGGLTVVQSAHNNLNQITSQSGGGSVRFKGATSEAATVSVQAKPATTTAGNDFEGKAQVGTGTATVAVVATDAAGNARTSNYQVNATGASSALTYDANGNLVSDGTKTYEWDALDQLVAVNQGALRSEFTYDGEGRRVRVVDKDSGTVTSDKRFLWCGLELCEQRDASGSVVQRRFYSEGVQDGGSNYFYAADHLGSVRELTDGSGVLQTRYDYTPFGKRTKVSGTLDADMGYTGHYTHPSSGLALTLFRAYDATKARWLSPDPIGLEGGNNLYAYVGNNPINDSDPLGLSGSGGGPPDWLICGLVGFINALPEIILGFILGFVLGAMLPWALTALWFIGVFLTALSVLSLIDAALRGELTAKQIAFLVGGLLAGMLAGKLARSPKAGVKVGLDFEQGFNAKEFARKVNRLAAAVKRGDATSSRPVTVSKAARRALTRAYRNDVTKRIESFYQNKPESMQRALDRLRASDIDHILDLQLGGRNVRGNLKTLHSETNQGLGRQIQPQIPVGDPVPIDAIHVNP